MTNRTLQSALLEFKTQLLELYGSDVEMTLFGSAARGDSRADSDIDILVLLPFQPDTTTEERIFDLAYDVELQYDVVFGVIVYSKSFWSSDLACTMPLHKNINREGVGV